MKVTVEDIKSIPANGVFRVKLDSYAACLSAKNIVQYVKNMYKREDGMTYRTSIDKNSFTFTAIVKPIAD